MAILSRSLALHFTNIFPLFVFAAFSIGLLPSAKADSAGTMVHARDIPTATLLQDGRVLVAGGQIRIFGNPSLTKSAELYDPVTNTWTATGDMRSVRVFHSAVLLPDGRVLVAGGKAKSNTAEIYNPATERWNYTGSMSAPHGDCDMVLLQSGLVLVPGGSYSGVAELYDPRTGSWSVTGSMLKGIRIGARATLLLDGRVLVAGGVTLRGGNHKVELYDPATGIWTYTGDLNMERWAHTQTLLADGRVLVAGGADPNTGNSRADAEIYDPATGMWTVTGSMSEGRTQMTANLLNNGKVAVIGSGISVNSEEYDPETGTWQIPQVQPLYLRVDHTTTTLLDGSLLIAGGAGNGRLIRPAERLFYP